MDKKKEKQYIWLYCKNIIRQYTVYDIIEPYTVKFGKFNPILLKFAPR